MTMNKYWCVVMSLAPTGEMVQVLKSREAANIFLYNLPLLMVELFPEMYGDVVSARIEQREFPLYMN